MSASQPIEITRLHCLSTNQKELGGVGYYRSVNNFSSFTIIQQRRQLLQIMNKTIKAISAQVLLPPYREVKENAKIASVAVSAWKQLAYFLLNIIAEEEEVMPDLLNQTFLGQTLRQFSGRGSRSITAGFLLMQQKFIAHFAQPLAEMVARLDEEQLLSAVFTNTREMRFVCRKR